MKVFAIKEKLHLCSLNAGQKTLSYFRETLEFEVRKIVTS
jgi:hypothetical protein